MQAVFSLSLITFYPLHNNILLGAGNPLNRKKERKNMNLTENFWKSFEEYKKVYQEYMGHSESEMPSDEALLEIAIRGDMYNIKKYMREFRKGRA